MTADPAPTRPLASTPLPAFFRDVRVLNTIGQIVFAVILVALVAAVWTSILASLRAKNLTPNIDFLGNRAGFDISERPAWYSSNNSYGDAFRVGVENSLRIIALGLVLTTIFGILGGIFLLSSNWLVRTITRAVVEVLRNTPLLVQLIAWYFVVMLSLPLFQEALSVPQESILPLSVRWGLYLIAIGAVWLLTRGTLSDVPRRALLRNGLIAAIVVIEIVFRWLPGQFASARLDNPLFLSYLVISIGLIAAVWFLIHSVFRWRLFGLAIGQLLGGLLFYFGIIPNSAVARIEVYPAVLLSKRGLVFPDILPTEQFGGWAVLMLIGLVLAAILWVYLGHITETTARPTQRALFAPLLIAGFAIIGFIIFSPFLYFPPAQKISPAGIVSGLAHGTQITPEYMALLLGLVIYTAAFIAEIVRAGILAVPPGQVEAARALGLSTNQTLGSVIMPQALRVIIPPLGNQYLNLAKNSSLAIAVAYADLVLVTQTVMNQSGQSVTGITMIMLTYLVISLVISALVNGVNRRFKIVTR